MVCKEVFKTLSNKYERSVNIFEKSPITISFISSFDRVLNSSLACQTNLFKAKWSENVRVTANSFSWKIRHGVKVGPVTWDGPRDPGTWDPGPSQSLKVRPGSPLKFKSGTPGPPLKFKSGTPGPPTKLKVGPPHLSLMNSFFSKYFFAFFTYLFLCLF